MGSTGRVWRRVACTADSQSLDPVTPETPSAAGEALPSATRSPDPRLTAAVPAPPPTPDEPSGSLVATATVAMVEVFSAPDADSERIHHLAHPNEAGAPRTFLVEDRRGEWLQVLLPVRPNGSTGWIRNDDVELTRTAWSVEVDLADFELRASLGDEVVIRSAIGYGSQDTSTPGGRYYLTELLRPPDPGSVYGVYAFGISGFSDVHHDFAGGEGVIGIHGTNDPSSIGNRVSNGCIRVPNDVITDLAQRLPLGTPVTITD